jgi:hypothetical protein
VSAPLGGHRGGVEQAQVTEVQDVLVGLEAVRALDVFVELMVEADQAGWALPASAAQVWPLLCTSHQRILDWAPGRRLRFQQTGSTLPRAHWFG